MSTDEKMSWLARLAPEMLRNHPQWSRIERWGGTFLEFFLAQGLMQLLAAISGFLLLRWMPVRDYGLMTLAFSVLGVMTTIVDLGIMGAIVPLVGSRTKDGRVIGLYVGAAKRLRAWLFPLTVLVGATVLAIYGRRQDLGWHAYAGILLLLVVTTWFTVVGDLANAVLIIRQRLRVVQATLTGMAAARLGIYAAAWICGCVSTWLALVVNAALVIIQACIYRSTARSLHEGPHGDSAELRAARSEIIRFSLPQLPIMVFNALQGQLMVFVIAIYGSQTDLADIGAVGRLAQLFAFVAPLMSWIIQPYFARLPAGDMLRRFWQCSVLGFVVLALVVATGILWPMPFLWFLGPHYHHLQSEVGWLLAATAVAIGQTLIGTMNNARRWIFWDMFLWFAGLTVAGQVIAASVCDLTKPTGAIALMVWGNAGGLVACLIIAYRGFRRDRHGLHASAA